MIVPSVNFVRSGSRAILDCTGVAPFFWEIKKGGGSLELVGDSAIFNSPESLTDGVTEIECLDSDGKTHSLSIGHGDEVLVVLDILKTELNLSRDQIHTAYQKFNIPNDNRVYIFGQLISPNVFANNFQRDLSEEQVMNFNSLFQIDIMSNNRISTEYLYRTISALSSPYSKKQQLSSGIRIHNIPQVSNTSAVEGTAGLTRFSVSFNLTYSKVIKRTQDYFDKFSDEIIVRE